MSGWGRGALDRLLLPAGYPDPDDDPLKEWRPFMTTSTQRCPCCECQRTLTTAFSPCGMCEQWVCSSCRHVETIDEKSDGATKIVYACRECHR